MIIISIIILYFKHITHTNDFPSTGNRLVIDKLSSKFTTSFFISVDDDTCDVRLC